MRSADQLCHIRRSKEAIKDCAGYFTYLLKEELGELWEQKDGRDAWGFLREWCAKAKAGGIRQLQAMAATLLRHAKGVLGYYKAGLTSGKMEGVNRKIRGLLASAFGFRDHDFLKLRL